ncbi:hypothetical protein Lal_00014695 [Lupinus albus]|nr:hypothetical protein Lal_00014695 [Lupinus albus]
MARLGENFVAFQFFNSDALVRARILSLERESGNLLRLLWPGTIHGAQPTLKSTMKTKEVNDKCDLAISKWMIDFMCHSIQLNHLTINQ